MRRRRPPPGPSATDLIARVSQDFEAAGHPDLAREVAARFSQAIALHPRLLGPGGLRRVIHRGAAFDALPLSVRGFEGDR